MEFEVDVGLLHRDPEELRRQVQDAYTACEQAVQDELGRHAPAGAANGQSPGQVNSNGAARRNGHSAPAEASGNGHVASEKQLAYARAARRGSSAGSGVRRLEDLSQRMFSKPLAALSGLNASSLIDTLKEIKAGRIDIEQALNGSRVMSTDLLSRDSVASGPWRRVDVYLSVTSELLGLVSAQVQADLPGWPPPTDDAQPVPGKDLPRFA